MFSTLYLHIGLEKTGTTSIQSFLDANTDALRDDGVFVPRTLGHLNHKILAAYAFDEGSRDIAVTSARDTHHSGSVEEYRAAVAATLAREIAGSTARTGIISSEDLSRLYSAPEVARVVDLLRPFCRDLKVVVFVRRQDLLASSRYYSLVLGGGRSTQVLTAPGQPPAPYYDYARNIGLWADAVGEANMILRRFPEHPSKEGFNSVRTFCDIVGVEEPAYEKVPPQHVSLDAVNQIILQNYNAMAKQDSTAEFAWLKDRLAECNDRQLQYIPSRAQAERFYMQFHADNQALFHRLGADDDMFSLDFSMYPKENMRTRFQQKAIRRLLALLIARRAETGA